MKAHILASDLSKLVSAACRAKASRSTLPVLSNLLLQTFDDNTIRVTGTNLQLTISMLAGAKVDETFAITVPANTLVDLLGTIPGDAELTLARREKDETLNLSSKKPKFSNNLKGIPAFEFPIMSLVAAQAGIELEPKLFKKAIGRVAFAAATNDDRPILTVVHIKANGTTVLFEAADGFRLARQEIDQATPAMDLCIPATALAEFAKLVDGESMITIGTSNGNQAVMTCGTVTVVSQLIEGIFPDLSAIIPKGKSKTIVMAPRLLLHKAFKSSEIFAREAGHTVRMKVSPSTADKPGLITVKATSAETGDSLGELDGTITGPEVEIAFNTKFLMDLLGNLDTEQVQIGLSASTSPGVMQPVNDDFGTYRHLVMPMHLGK